MRARPRDLRTGAGPRHAPPREPSPAPRAHWCACRDETRTRRRHRLSRDCGAAAEMPFGVRRRRDEETWPETSSGGAQDPCDRPRVLRPRGMLGAKLLAPLGGEPVVARPAIVFRDAPLTLDRTLLLEPVERLVERSIIDVERVLRPLAQPNRDGIAVHGLPGETLEHEHVE